MATRMEAPRPEVEALRAAQDVDVLVIGGGINGLGVLRELALQGLSASLVERSDYCSGASAASSHMIHGGVRYLENGEFRLVRESVAERNGLLKVAPHYVKPLRTTIPIFSTFSGIVAAPLRFLTHREGRRHVERGAVLIKVGLTLYDAFSRDGARLPRHRFRRHAAAVQDLPRLRPDVRYTATYFDASVHDPERLALDVLRDALAAGDGAQAVHAANYVEAVGAEGDAVRLRDRETGTEFLVRPRVVVNTSGPWTDLTNGALGDETALMGGTKGSHIVLDNDELLAATKGREIFFEHEDGRIVLIYPLKGRVLVGTTDIEADPRRTPVCSDDEIEYFFELIRHVFPDVPVERDQIVFTFSGIRPLPRHDDLQPGFVSRDYNLVRDDAVDGGPIRFSLVGGKWTTFRALGGRVARDVLAALGRGGRTSTVDVPIGGGAGWPAEAERAAWIEEHRGSLPVERMRQLLGRYGTRSIGIAAVLADGDDAMAAVPGFSRQEVAHLAATEHVVHLTDVLLRRTPLAFTGALSDAALAELADVAGAPLGWSAERRDAEVARAADELLRVHRVRLGASGASLAEEDSTRSVPAPV